MRSNISLSDIFAITAESCQASIFRLMEAARSPFPSPLVPWHMAQSKPKNFLASAKFSGVGLRGFVRSMEDVVSEETSASFDSCDGFLLGGVLLPSQAQKWHKQKPSRGWE